MSIVAALVVLLGFSRTYFLKAWFGTPELTPLIHLHAVVFSSWVALFIAQTYLVAAHRTDIHRRLGIFGGLLACAMVVVGSLAAIESARLGRAPNPGVPPLKFLAIPLFSVLIFAIVIFAALYLRRRPDHHKRLMLIATLSIMPPAIARMQIGFIQTYRPFSAFGLSFVLIIGAVAYDTFQTRRLHPAFLWSGTLAILSFPLRLAIAGTNGWMSFAHWLTR